VPTIFYQILQLSLTLINNDIVEINPDDVELNPQAVSFVDDYIRTQGEELEDMKTWAKPYFELYDTILSSYGIPKQMKYLSVIESHLVPGLVSWAGAVGPWQIMPDEAKRFGLRRSGSVDERKDFAKSTGAAALLMKELIQQVRRLAAGSGCVQCRCRWCKKSHP
jgi:membrane-bound lytic murein transglycosylase D